MHNRHFIIVQADSGKDAVGTALTYIEDWGTENNWREAVGAISNKGRKYGDHNYTLKKINRIFEEMVQKADTGFGTTDEDYQHLADVMKRLVEGGFTGAAIKDIDNLDIWRVKNFMKHIYAVSNVFDNRQINKETIDRPFDVFKDVYMPYEYDEGGVTHQDENGNWCVIIDMHS